MAIEKSLYSTPAGIGGLEEDSPIEIEIINPEGVVIGMDGVEIEIEPGGEGDDDFNANLAENMTEAELQKIASELSSQIDDDINARKDWADMYVKGLDVLGNRYEDMTEPWDGACGVFSTVLNEAAIRFRKIS